MEGAVDRDGGLFFEVVAQSGVELVHRLDDAAQISGLDLKFAYSAGVAAAEPGGEDDARSHYSSLPRRPPRPGLSRPSTSSQRLPGKAWVAGPSPATGFTGNAVISDSY